MPVPTPEVAPSLDLTRILIELVSAITVTGVFTWKYAGDMLYVWFRGMILKVIEKDGELIIKPAWSKLYAVEMAANVDSRHQIDSMRADMTRVMDDIAHNLPRIGDLTSAIHSMTEKLGGMVEVVTDIAKEQKEHGGKLIRMDERGKASDARISEAIKRWDGVERRQHEVTGGRTVERRARKARTEDTERIAHERDDDE